MKIALIRKNYTPYGGAENYLNLMAKSLIAKGHNVHIFSAVSWPEGFTVHRIKTIRKPSFLSNVHFALKSRDVLKRESFDCVLSLERTFYQDIYRAGDGCHKEWLNKRTVIEPFYKKASFSINPGHIALLYLEKKCFLHSKVIIANSDMVKADIIRHYPFSENKIQVLYNGVDLLRFQPVKKEIKIARKRQYNIEAEKIILFIGADFKRKGLQTLLRAFALMDRQNVVLLVAGKHPTEEYVKMTRKLGIDNSVIFQGPDDNVENLYAVADVFVLPTIYDPFSNATLEAMASGLPVITTDSNGASEIISNGVEGYTIENPVDAALFSEKIGQTLLNSKKMGQQARQRAEAHSIEKAISKFVDIISSECVGLKT